MNVTQFSKLLLENNIVYSYLSKSYDIDTLFIETKFDGSSLQMPCAVDYGRYSRLIGICIDCLTRFCIDCSAEKAFKDAILCAYYRGNAKRAYDLVKVIDYVSLFVARNDYHLDSSIKVIINELLSEDVVISAFELSKFTVDSFEDILLTEQMIFNIRVSVGRNLHYFAKYHKGAAICGSQLFGDRNAVAFSGDFDYIIGNSLIDLKTGFFLHSNRLKFGWLVQLSTYYIIGVRCGVSLFDSLDSLVIYNPTHQREFRFYIHADVSSSFIAFVSWWLGYECNYANIGDYNRIGDIKSYYVNENRVRQILKYLCS